ncbi:hypothetical protein [Pseudomonas aeruginosa]|uniref:hypothetical protein n=1 Tax=Pseudomonas aeruginosa TaxID=287 RepID=UPI0005BAC683|nr:hypothetical protein [Pseudomonas aeruginosa]
MADAYPIVPVSFIDGLNDLNCSLEAYHTLMLAWVRVHMEDTSTGRVSAFVNGLEEMFRPILEGYQGIESMCTAARDMGMVGTATLDPDVAPQASRE